MYYPVGSVVRTKRGMATVLRTNDFTIDHRGIKVRLYTLRLNNLTTLMVHESMIYYGCNTLLDGTYKGQVKKILQAYQFTLMGKELLKVIDSMETLIQAKE